MVCYIELGRQLSGNISMSLSSNGANKLGLSHYKGLLGEYELKDQPFCQIQDRIC